VYNVFGTSLPTRNSTTLLIPRLELACAVAVIVAGEENFAPLSGDVRLTTGGVAVATLMVMPVDFVERF
jgi:hypothetical protein